MPPQAATLPLLLVQGSWAEARELAQATRERGSPLERHMAITVLGNLAYFQGDARQAWAMVRELLPRGPDSEPEASLFPYAIDMLRLAARLALDASDFSAAASWLKAHDYWLTWSGSVRGRAEASMLRARLHELQGDTQRANQLAVDALNLASDPRQPLVLLEVHQVLGDIAMREGRYDDAERDLGTALDLADACSIPYQRAATLVRLAELFGKTDRKQEARGLPDEAREIASGLEAAPLLDAAESLESRLKTVTRTSSLSGREIEVLRLVTEGLTDAEAAERLYISPRTVGQHLRSIYNKLGVSSRAAATRVAVEDNLL